MAWLSEREVDKVGDVTTTVARQFARYLGSRKLSKNTIRRKLSTYQRWWKWIFRSQAEDFRGPFAGMTLMDWGGVHKDPDRTITSAMIDRVRCDDPLQQARDRAYLELVRVLGLTSRTATSMTIDDVDPEGRFVAINGDRRTIPARSMKILRTYLEERDRHGLLSESLWVSVSPRSRGRGISASALAQIRKDCLTR